MFRLTRILSMAAVSLALALPLSAQCGDFQWQNPSPQGNRLSGVAFGRGTFVAVGAAGTVLTSPDGVSWTARVTNSAQDLDAIAFDGTKFTAVGSGGAPLVAVGDHGAVATSPDGAFWIARSSGTAKALRDVAWGGGQFIAVGETGTLLASADGASWASRSIETNDTFYSVAWNGSSFVVGATGFMTISSVLTSRDGLAWTSTSTGLSLPIQSMQSTSSGL